MLLQNIITSRDAVTGTIIEIRHTEIEAGIFVQDNDTINKYQCSFMNSIFQKPIRKS